MLSIAVPTVFYFSVFSIYNKSTRPANTTFEMFSFIP